MAIHFKYMTSYVLPTAEVLQLVFLTNTNINVRAGLRNTSSLTKI